MCQSAVSAFLRCRFVRELGAAKRAVLPDVPHQTARSSAEMHQLRGWGMALPGIAAFLHCRSARGLGAAKCAVLPDAPHQAAWSNAEVHQLRGWKTALPEIPASWVRDAPDL